jgi:hypothetical protein
MKILTIFAFFVFCAATATAAERPYYSEEPHAAEIIRSKCKKDWPDNFGMRSYCEDEQWKGLKELYGRGENPK